MSDFSNIFASNAFTRQQVEALRRLAAYISGLGGGGGGAGDVVGPVSSVDNNVALFDGVTGKLIKGGGAFTAANIGADTVGSAAAAQAASAPVAHVGAGAAAHANAIAAGAAGFMTGADKTKLDGIATGATANSADATLLARANHTGTQAAATISDFNASSRAQTEAMLVAGTNIVLTPASSGATRTITIDASGGGGGLSLPVAMAVSSLRL